MQIQFALRPFSTPSQSTGIAEGSVDICQQIRQQVPWSSSTMGSRRSANCSFGLDGILEIFASSFNVARNLVDLVVCLKPVITGRLHHSLFNVTLRKLRRDLRLHLFRRDYSLGGNSELVSRFARFERVRASHFLLAIDGVLFAGVLQRIRTTTVHCRLTVPQETPPLHEVRLARRRICPG